jgi:hypothetical protein
MLIWGKDTGVLMNWDAEAIKVLVFTPSPLPDAVELWQKIAGTKSFPDNVAKKGLPLPLVATASGEWNGYSLTVNLQLRRIEVGISGIDSDPTGPTPTPPIPFEKIGAAVDEMKSVAAWLHKGLSAVRFAAISQLVTDVESELAGTALINKEVDGIDLPDGADSLIFQLNKKREFGDGLVVNRVLKWGVARLGVVGVGIDAAGGSVTALPPSDFTVRAFMHVDVNNRPLAAPIGDGDAAKLISYMWEQEAELRKGGWNAL